MDSSVKYQANQGLFSATQNQIDVVIPADTGIYDLSKCYVSILTQVQSAYDNDATIPFIGAGDSDDGVPDMVVSLKHNGSGSAGSDYDKCSTPVECLVRNCRMESSTRGIVEHVQRSDTLRGTLRSYISDLDSCQARSFTGIAGAQKDYPWVDGNYVEKFRTGTLMSRVRTHEIQIKLSDLFSAGEFEAWDSSVYGNTTIHLETQFDKVELTQNLGSTAAVWNTAYQNRTESDGTTVEQSFQYKTVKTVTAAIAGSVWAVPGDQPADTTQNFLVMAIPYECDADIPFYVGQQIEYTVTNTDTSSGTGALTSGCIMTLPESKTLAQNQANSATGRSNIKSISRDPQTGLVKLNFDTPIITRPNQTDGTFGGTLVCVVKGRDVAAGATVEYQAVNLIASRRVDMASGEAPREHEYNQFLNQADSFTSTTQYQSTYQIPAGTSCVLIALPCVGDPAKSDILGSARVLDYRFSIGNVLQTNRPIPYFVVKDTATTASAMRARRGSSLHYEQVVKTLMNAGIEYESLKESIYSQTIPIGLKPNGGAPYNLDWGTMAANPAKPVYMIGLPIPLSQDSTQLLVELNGDFAAGTGQLQIYSLVTSTI